MWFILCIFSTLNVCVCVWYVILCRMFGDVETVGVCVYNRVCVLDLI